MNTNHTLYAGLYVHIPFCVRKCPYCDFFSICETGLEAAYVNALQQEMELRSTTALSFDSLYIGGGTPSVLDASAIDRVIQAAYQNYAIRTDAEITIEVNPGTVTPQKLRDYRKSGINRINIGVQSFQDETLNFLGRIHTAADAMNVLRQARRAGFENLGFDLIYGVPGQTSEQWRNEMDRALAFRPEHLSCYMLTFEADTPLDQLRQQGIIQPLPDFELSRLFETTLSYLNNHGMAQYEISNFAAHSSYRSRHNQKYWGRVPYMGFGPSAHSFFPSDSRSWNYRSVQKYMTALEKGRRPTASQETLSREQQIVEMIYVGLRKTDGMDLEQFKQWFDIDLQVQCRPVLESLCREHYLKLAGQKCFLTAAGQLLSDSIAVMLIEALQ